MSEMVVEVRCERRSVPRNHAGVLWPHVGARAPVWAAV